ncbi:MAG: hypothetical protein J7641_20500 [Cyanobacteria bacterium SID2]|nr:hypothetical protein [Cyanobacteria bacterium SID2]MBP0003507.1 hypothetical protein [Cyanobacteria bacterium SBC]
MQRHSFRFAIAIALGSVLAIPNVAFGESVQLAAGFQTETRSGMSGGTRNSNDCGFVSATPNHQLQLTEDFSYLRLSVAGEGQPTLVVVGPSSDDRFCARNTPQQSGYWPQGTYDIYVGNLDGGSHPYTLSISEIP